MDGVLLRIATRLKPGVVEHLHRLDALGILHPVASRNDPELALAKLREFGIEDMFVYPRIGWNPKSESIRELAAKLNLGLDAFAFVDDQEFERAEVSHSLPQVMCIDAQDIDTVLHRVEFQPRFVTDESAQRRHMYRNQIARDEAEANFVGTNEEFLASLDMTSPSRRRPGKTPAGRGADHPTNQLNSTGRTYSYEELDALRESPEHLLLVASLQDRFGSYGRSGWPSSKRATRLEAQPAADVVA